MIKYFQRPLDFLLFSNIFISLGALAQGLLTYHLLGFSPSWVVVGFLFFSTLLTYNFSILIQRPKNPEKSEYRRVRWIFGNYKLNVGISIVALVAIIPLFFMLSFRSQLLNVFLGILSLGYAMPLFKSKNTKFGLRNVPAVKLFLIAAVWALSSVMIPYFELQNTQQFYLPWQDIAILNCKRFLFLVAITVPFDIRDMFQDRVYELRTIPTIFGEKKAYLFCQVMLLTYMVLLFFFRNRGFDADFFGLGITAVLTGWLIFKSKWEKNEYYYFFYLDGTLILQYVMMLFFGLLI
ncbi:UbiA prenyltransferase family protein [Pedobacter arcticus]|uniref:hypothetical protein n=1 Tax=Pedobacter arcticus TaxID=752140 RepID=UPI0002DF7EF0|nr:hypothetical protein [Pedobacter arcticus]